MKNQTSKYFKYAVGEIILVVIGILIALQINNWNENRKLNLQEQTALNNIHRDFLKNKAILEDVKTSTELIMKHGVQILNHTGSKTKPDSEDIFNSWLNELYNSTPYYPQNGFLDDLLSSGKLSIFKNAELRNLLSSWKPEVEILEERFSTVDKNEDILNAYIIEHGSWLNADQVAENRNVNFPVSGFTVDNRDLLKVLQFENLVENLVIAADNYYSTQKKTEKLLDDINTLLETEIQKQQ
ncbi:DUF6090 family protein [Psychroserpens sp. SPM9]|uniref:DUF6090 family protein n=1 Tax=Psychroserpens sp. SPM9 TaxID=2975598 RepID=UPI0021A2D964|nr:DUF6090 family protein [Psychroserpens sp. SPM9]MDG5491778.1 DUF6090 family protein [Psychroserpens sp. SPM9]